MISFFIFIFGLIIGSFLNVVIYRFASGDSLVFGRSKCPKCNHILLWYELIPLLSFFMQRGRCRACKKGINMQYPAVELVTGLLFLFIYQYLPEFYRGIEMVYLFFIFSALLVILVFDLKYYIIPNRVLYPLIIIVFVHLFIGADFISRQNALWSAFCAFAFFFVLYITSAGKWIGFGDVKFGIFMGAFLGFPYVVMGIFFAYWLGAVVSIVLLIRGGKTLKSQIPFGPFLVIGTTIAYFYGNNILWWYLSIL